jgi:predicted amino acid-binding ACT domain protein
VGLLTLGAGIESPTRSGSDQTAAEALQEAETEVGTQVKVVREFGFAAVHRSTNKVIDVGLTA